jgi:hypothetical protein
LFPLLGPHLSSVETRPDEGTLETLTEDGLTEDGLMEDVLMEDVLTEDVLTEDVLTDDDGKVEDCPELAEMEELYPELVEREALAVTEKLAGIEELN